MTWNYRVVRYQLRGGETIFALHEVYSHGSWTERAVDLDGFDSVKELKKSLEMMLQDIEKYPVVDLKDLFKRITR